MEYCHTAAGVRQGPRRCYVTMSHHDPIHQKNKHVNRDYVRSSNIHLHKQLTRKYEVKKKLSSMDRISVSMGRTSNGKFSRVTIPYTPSSSSIFSQTYSCLNREDVSVVRSTPHRAEYEPTFLGTMTTV